MANIKALAGSARTKLARGDATTMGIAIRMAINGDGILHQPDVRRLMRQVGTLIAREDAEEGKIRHAEKRG